MPQVHVRCQLMLDALGDDACCSTVDGRRYSNDTSIPPAVRLPVESNAHLTCVLVLVLGQTLVL